MTELVELKAPVHWHDQYGNPLPDDYGIEVIISRHLGKRGKATVCKYKIEHGVNGTVSQFDGHLVPHMYITH